MSEWGNKKKAGKLKEGLSVNKMEAHWEGELKKRFDAWEELVEGS